MLSILILLSIREVAAEVNGPSGHHDLALYGPRLSI